MRPGYDPRALDSDPAARPRRRMTHGSRRVFFPTSIPALAVRRLRAPDDYPRVTRSRTSSSSLPGSSSPPRSADAVPLRAPRPHGPVPRRVPGRARGVARRVCAGGVGTTRRQSGPMSRSCSSIRHPTGRSCIRPCSTSSRAGSAELAASHRPGPKVVRAEVTDAGRLVEATLRERGYRPIQTFHVMVRPTLDDLPDAPLPEGLAIRDERRAHGAIYEVELEAFREHCDADAGRQRASPVLRRPGGRTRRCGGSRGTATGSRAASELHPRRPERALRRGSAAGSSTSASAGRGAVAASRAPIAASFPLLRARGMTEGALGVDTRTISAHRACAVVRLPLG